MKTLTTIVKSGLTIYLVQNLEDFEEAFVKEIGDGETPEYYELHGGYMMAEKNGVRVIYRRNGIFPTTDFE